MTDFKKTQSEERQTTLGQEAKNTIAEEELSGTTNKATGIAGFLYWIFVEKIWGSIVSFASSVKYYTWDLTVGKFFTTVEPSEAEKSAAVIFGEYGAEQELNENIPEAKPAGFSEDDAETEYLASTLASKSAAVIFGEYGAEQELNENIPEAKPAGFSEDDAETEDPASTLASKPKSSD